MVFRTADDRVIDEDAGNLRPSGCSVPFLTMCSTCTITMPPLARAAWAMDSDSSSTPRGPSTRCRSRRPPSRRNSATSTFGFAVVEPFLAVEIHHLDQILDRRGIHLGAFEARSTRFPARPWTKASRRPAICLGSCTRTPAAGWQASILLSMIRAHQLRPADAEVAADDALERTLAGEVVDAAVLCRCRRRWR